MHINTVLNPTPFSCFAVKVRSRAESTVTELLRSKGYDVLLPTYTDRRKYTDRVKKAHRALFPGYVFVRFDPANVHEVVTTQGVSYIVRTGNMLQPLAQEEEITLERLCDLIDGCTPCENFAVGERVWIRSGPLQDRQGTLVRVGGKDRLVLSIDSIFSSVSVDLRDTAVSRCDA